MNMLGGNTGRKTAGIGNIGGVPIGDDGNLPVKFGDSPSIDAFDRLRVSSPVGIFESTLQYDKQPLLWSEEITGGALSLFNADEAAVHMQVSSSGDAVKRQTRTYFRYQPGKSQLVFMTFTMAGVSDANVRRRVGYFDVSNGIFLEEVDGELWIVRRSFTSGVAVDTRVIQADWNIDRLDALDITKSQILCLDLEWLGVGRVRVGFVIDGIIQYVHEFLNANNLDKVYMTSAQLPLRLEIEATDTPSAQVEFHGICGSVISEGGVDEFNGFPFATRTTVLKTIDGPRIPILSIRPRATFGPSGVINRIQTVQREMEVFNNANVIIVDVIYSGILTGASWTPVNNASSSLEMDSSATAITSGTLVKSFFVGSSNQVKTAVETSLGGRLPLALDINGENPTSITITATPLAADGAALAAFSWQEFR
jgi:hypothetical protein